MERLRRFAPYVPLCSIALTASIYASMNSGFAYVCAGLSFCVSVAGLAIARQSHAHYPVVVNATCAAMAVFGAYVKFNIP
jgi:hypothetical protein